MSQSPLILDSSRPSVYGHTYELATLLVYSWLSTRLILFLTFHFQTNSLAAGRGWGLRARFAQERRAGEEEEPQSPALGGRPPPL